MEKLAFVFDKLDISQITISIIRQLDKLKESKPDISICLFTEEQSWIPIPVRFPILSLADGYFADYTMVCNNISVANKLRNFPNAKERFFFLQAIEWLYIKNKQFSELHNIYCSNNLKIVAPSMDYAKIFERTWNRQPDMVVDGFKLDLFLELL